MIYKKYILSFFFFFSTASILTGQDVNLLKGNHAFDLRHYDKAAQLYSDYGAILTDKKSLEKRALCYFYLNRLKDAIADFTRSKRLGNENVDLYFYMARSKQLLNELDEASFFYTTYLKEADDDNPLFYEAKREIKNCAYAATNLKPNNDVLVQSFDDVVNSKYDEINVLQSPLFGNRYYVSSNRNKIDFEILSFELNENGSWVEIDSIDEVYNTTSNNILADIDANDGSALLVTDYQEENKGKKTVFNTFDELEQNIQIELPEELFKTAIDFQIVNPNLLAFSDNRPNGYGGYDIYTIRFEDGEWGPPVNAGGQINSNFDERCPFFSSDMEHLYFSSNRPYAYGGYDIYYAQNETYIDVRNLGNPINSAADELFWRLDDEGHMATFSSNRVGGQGGFDLYFAYLQNIKTTYYKDTIRFAYLTSDEVLERLSPQVEEVNANSEMTEDSSVVLSKKISASEDSLNYKNDEALELKDINISPPSVDHAFTLLYQDKHDLTSDINKNKLDYLVKAFSEKDCKIMIEAYTDHLEPGLVEYVQYNSLKRGVATAEYLIENGLDASNITVQSFAANYPLTKAEIAGKPNTSSQYLNKRVDIQVIFQDSVYKDDVLSDFSLEQYEIDARYEIFKSIQTDLFFSVEINHAPRIFKNAILRLYNDIFVRRDMSNGLNEYFIGLYTKLEDAEALKSDLEESSAPYAHLVAFYKGEKLSEKEANHLKSVYPELAKLSFK